MMKELKLKGTIDYTIDKDHPDYAGQLNCHVSDVMTFSIYDPLFNPSGYWAMGDLKAMKQKLKEHLMLVAGGGYDINHIHDVKYHVEFV